MNDYDVIVVGAGPGGSIAAAYLAQAGLRTVVFDRGDVGGRLEGFERDGFHLDRHIHVIMRNIQLNEGLGNWGKAAIETKANLKWESVPQNAIWLNSKETLWPFCSSGDAFADFIGKMMGAPLPPETRVELSKVFDAAMRTSVKDLWSERFDQTPAIEWLNEVTDDPMVHMMLRHFTAMIMITSDDIALETVSINALVTCVFASAIAGWASSLYKFVEPADTMPKAFCDVVTRHGGQVLPHNAVKKVIVESGKATGVVAVDRKGVDHTYRAKYIVNTACYPELRKLLGSDMPKKIDDIITDLYRSDTVALDVHLGLKKKVLPHLSSQLMLVTDEMNYEGVIATYTNLDPAWAPPGKQAINIELFLNPTDYKKKSAEEWFEQMQQSVLKRWPKVKPEIEWVESFIVPSASLHQNIYAVKKLPHESGIGGLYFAGDCTAGEGFFTERASGSGAKVAEMILKREGKH